MHKIYCNQKYIFLHIEKRQDVFNNITTQLDRSNKASNLRRLKRHSTTPVHAANEINSKTDRMRGMFPSYGFWRANPGKLNKPDFG